MRALLRLLGNAPTTTALTVAVLLLILVLKATDWTAELLWMTALGHAEVFWTLRETKVALFFAAALPTAFYVGLNLRIAVRRTDLARRLLTPGGPGGSSGPGGDAAGLALPVLAALLAALIVGFAFYSSWDLALRFLHGPEVGRGDPVFGRDLGFHLFAVPFLELVANWALVLTLVMTGVLAAGYGYAGLLAGGRAPDGSARTALMQLAANGALVLLALAWRFWLDRFGLLTDSSGVVHGAGYVDVTVTRWMLWAAAGLSLAAIPAVLWLARRGAGTPLLAAAGGYALAAFALIQLVPGFYQDFVVAPNELELERPYLERNIAGTRAAFQLDQIRTRSYTPEPELTLQEVQANQDTVEHIRLWDPRPLARTFQQLQRIRAYYEFNDVDVDRYRLGGDYREVLLSARELSPELPGKGNTWVNRRLQYTHGIGLAMADASTKSPEGTPELMVKDLPPRSLAGLEIDRPEIYYGEGMGGYRIVATGVREFDYPKGDDNVYTSYQGEGGVRLDAGWKVGLFALHQRSTSLMLTDYLQDTSRIQFWRALQDRVRRLAPFLRLDRDPYLVTANGRLYWIQDAYTTSRNYPYAEPYAGGVNYMRNSVKIVVDAYDGHVDLYAFEPDDPVLRAYRSAFPDLIQPKSAMPAGLRRHVRYPSDLFDVQVRLYSTYHMTVPQVFYNREDIWAVPNEKYGGEAMAMEPYYIVMRLPGHDRLEFLLMQPLTPSNRDNMIAWVAARSDPPHYGELLVYKLPKERLVLGPMQMEAKIDQDTIMSRQLSLWDQRGSRVIRGNLLVIPIEESFLYVEPVYLLAEGTEIPQLKRIIVSDGDKLAMKPTLQGAIDAVFGRAPRRPAGPAAAGQASAGARAFPQLQQAQDALGRAQEALETGDWPAFGRAMGELKRTLEQAAPADAGPPAPDAEPAGE